MLPGLNKPLRHCTLSDLHRHSECSSARHSQAQRKYSVGLLEEAFKLSIKVGMSDASRQTGVNVNSLSHYAQIRRKEAGHVPAKLHGRKITDAQKRDCLKLMKRLHDRGFSKGKRKCWIEAGRLLGVNGRSIEFQFVRGLWTP